MASTPQKIHVSVLASATTLYTSFVGAGTRAMLVSLDLTNTTSADITIDVYHEDGSAVKKYFAKTLTVPALGQVSYRGMQTIDTASEFFKAIASATGVDATGTVVENA